MILILLNTVYYLLRMFIYWKIYRETVFTVVN